MAHAVLRHRARRIDFDEGDAPPEPEAPFVQYPIDPTLVDVPITLEAGTRIMPAYMVVYDREGRPIYRTAISAPADLLLLPGESLTISATIQIL